MARISVCRFVARALGVGLLGFMVAGCASYRRFILDTAEAANERQWKGCICVNVVAGAGFGGGLTGAAGGFLATGGVDENLCLEVCD